MRGGTLGGVLTELPGSIPFHRSRAPLVVRSRQVRVAAIARTHRICPRPGITCSPHHHTPPGIDCRANPAAARDHESTRRAEAPPDRVWSASSSSRLPIPLLSQHANNRVRTERTQPDRGQRPRAGGVTPMEEHAGPAVKTNNPSLSPRGAQAPSVAFELGRESRRRASSLPTVLPFGPFAHPDLKSCSHVSARIGGVPPAAGPDRTNRSAGSLPAPVKRPKIDALRADPARARRTSIRRHVRALIRPTIYSSPLGRANRESRQSA